MKGRARGHSFRGEYGWWGEGFGRSCSGKEVRRFVAIGEGIGDDTKREPTPHAKQEGVQRNE